MKINETLSPGIIQSVYTLDIDVLKAQRQAEIEQMATYHALKMKYYRDWSASGGDVKATFGEDLEAEMDLVRKMGDIKLDAVRHDPKALKISPLAMEPRFRDGLGLLAKLQGMKTTIKPVKLSLFARLKTVVKDVLEHFERL